MKKESKQAETAYINVVHKPVSEGVKYLFPKFGDILSKEDLSTLIIRYKSLNTEEEIESYSGIDDFVTKSDIYNSKLRELKEDNKSSIINMDSF